MAGKYTVHLQMITQKQCVRRSISEMSTKASLSISANVNDILSSPLFPTLSSHYIFLFFPVITLWFPMWSASNNKYYVVMRSPRPGLEIKFQEYTAGTTASRMKWLGYPSLTVNTSSFTYHIRLSVSVSPRQDDDFQLNSTTSATINARMSATYTVRYDNSKEA